MRDGHLNQCKPCFSTGGKARYQRNPEPKREYRREYEAANKAKVSAYRASYRSLNKEAVDAYHREYRETHADERRASGALYKSDNPEQVRKHRRRRKARERGTFVADAPEASLAQKLGMFGGRCAYCGTDVSAPGLHWDHWKPLSKDGLHMLSNLFPSCPPCNLRKGSKWPFKAPVNYSSRNRTAKGAFL